MNYIKELLKALSPIDYKGCTIWPEDGKFRSLSKTYDTLEDAKAAIDQAFQNLLNQMFK